MNSLKKPFKPILAASICKATDSEEMLDINLANLIYPVLATPKLDGIRCTTMNWVPSPGKLSAPVCRSLKQVPNDYIRERIAECPTGLDGEIMTYSHADLLDPAIGNRPRPFHNIQSDVMCVAGVPAFKYHVFDCNIRAEDRNYCDRVRDLGEMKLPDFVVKVLPIQCRDAGELRTFFAKCLQEGHEGICFRTSLYCPYKHGRSTLREQWLIKWKKFHTAEATIIGFEEEMHNANAPMVGLLGQVERQTLRQNMHGKNRLGALVVEMGDQKFNIGTGFSADQRENMWLAQAALLGRQVTFAYQPHGTHECPRIPVFISIRDPRDI